MREEFLWVEKYRPRDITTCVLPTETKKIFIDFVNNKEIPNLLLCGTAGVGKTTAARILGDLTDFTTLEEDCAADSSKARMLSLIKGTTSVSLFGTRRIIIMDEFHEVPMPVQKVFNKWFLMFGPSEFIKTNIR